MSPELKQELLSLRGQVQHQLTEIDRRLASASDEPLREAGQRPEEEVEGDWRVLEGLARSMGITTPEGIDQFCAGRFGVKPKEKAAAEPTGTEAALGDLAKTMHLSEAGRKAFVEGRS